MFKHLASAGLFALLSFSSLSATALTTIQTSTSLGYYRDYGQNSRYPMYLSWSLRGIYGNGVETSINFLLNNDFTVNKWTFFPSQAEFDIPIGQRFVTAPERQSRIRLGRQLLTEGFDFAILDGVQMPYYWSATGGIMPLAGSLRATDMDQATDSSTPLVGAVVWERIFNFQIRTGVTAREEKLDSRLFFFSFVREFNSLPLDPQLLVKEEWNLDNMGFNQLASDLSFSLSERLTGRLGYTNLQPRPIQKKEITSFIYRLFAVTPTEAVQTDFNWEFSDKVRWNFGAERAFYNSGLRNETSDRQDLSADFEFGNGHWITPSLLHLSTYGGEVHDMGLRYTLQLNSDARYLLEYDLAYMRKINNIHGWVQHLRTGYETQVAHRAKALFNVEAERNQYFEIDLRTMAYVTTYL